MRITYVYENDAACVAPHRDVFTAVLSVLSPQFWAVVYVLGPPIDPVARIRAVDLLAAGHPRLLSRRFHLCITRGARSHSARPTTLRFYRRVTFFRLHDTHDKRVGITEDASSA